ncbi:hypothetical protein K438DRAFT_1968680 [Mycena galopus ATCC 62051]|nr:hypothetical protein K438DRAFT_1968680 [Mycena galopus ATCC 62051]
MDRNSSQKRLCKAPPRAHRGIGPPSSSSSAAAASLDAPAPADDQADADFAPAPPAAHAQIPPHNTSYACAEARGQAAALVGQVVGACVMGSAFVPGRTGSRRRPPLRQREAGVPWYIRTGTCETCGPLTEGRLWHRQHWQLHVGRPNSSSPPQPRRKPQAANEMKGKKHAQSGGRKQKNGARTHTRDDRKTKTRVVSSHNTEREGPAERPGDPRWEFPKSKSQRTKNQKITPDPTRWNAVDHGRPT